MVIDLQISALILAFQECFCPASTARSFVNLLLSPTAIVSSPHSASVITLSSLSVNF